MKDVNLDEAVFRPTLAMIVIYGLNMRGFPQNRPKLTLLKEYTCL